LHACIIRIGMCEVPPSLVVFLGVAHIVGLECRVLRKVYRQQHCILAWQDAQMQLSDQKNLRTTYCVQ
jgi:hypothetical protein